MEEESLHKLSDAELLKRFQEHNDTSCTTVLYDRYKHLVKGTAMKYLKNQVDANDMVSHVFSVLIEKLPEREVHDFKKYLYGTVRNECMAHLRKQKRSREKEEAWQHTEKYSDQFMENDGYLHLSNERPLEDLLKEVITQLSENQQQCIELFYLKDNNSYEDVAQMTGYSLKNVKSYLQNGKRNLKKLLETHPDFNKQEGLE